MPTSPTDLLLAEMARLGVPLTPGEQYGVFLLDDPHLKYPVEIVIDDRLFRRWIDRRLERGFRSWRGDDVERVHTTDEMISDAAAEILEQAEAGVYPALSICLKADAHGVRWQVDRDSEPNL